MTPCLPFEGVVPVVIALVGKTHSNKSKIAQYITRYSKGKFERVITYTTCPTASARPHTWMSNEDFQKLHKEDFFYCHTFEEGQKYFVLKSQLLGEGDKILVVDDPQYLKNLPALGVPYVIVFVGCSNDIVLDHARSVDDITETKMRLAQTGDRLREFKKSGDYNMYINTAKLVKSSQQLAIAMFVDEVLTWQCDRESDEMHLPFIGKNISLKSYSLVTNRFCFK